MYSEMMIVRTVSAIRYCPCQLSVLYVLWAHSRKPNLSRVRH